LFSDERNEIGFEEHPTAADLRARHDTRTRLTQQRLRADAQKLGRFH
jgi:hypothetical protein